MALRKLLRPFLRKVHPDVLHSQVKQEKYPCRAGGSKNNTHARPPPPFQNNTQATAAVKRTNEQSLQQLNTILDTLECLGQGQQGQGKTQAMQPPYLEASYELTFHLASSSASPSAPDGAAATQAYHGPSNIAASPSPPPSSLPQPHSFTARLTFPSTTVSRFAREAPLATAARAASGTPHVPEEISLQLRKLFQGARLKVPKELEGQASRRRGQGKGAAGARRGALMGAAEVEEMVLADLMVRDLKVEGPSEAQRRAAVVRLLRSGRVMTKGLSVAEEVVALQDLEQVLVAEWERGNLGEVAASVQLLLDAETEVLYSETLPHRRGHLIVCPADVKGSRFRLASLLRGVGRQAEGNASNGAGFAPPPPPRGQRNPDDAFV